MIFAVPILVLLAPVFIWYACSRRHRKDPLERIAEIFMGLPK